MNLHLLSPNILSYFFISRLWKFGTPDSSWASILRHVCSFWHSFDAYPPCKSWQNSCKVHQWVLWISCSKLKTLLLPWLQFWQVDFEFNHHDTNCLVDIWNNALILLEISFFHNSILYCNNITADWVLLSFSTDGETDLNAPVWLAMLLITIFLTFDAIVFMFMEHWSFGNSLYFIFVTLTTIGFGDIVPQNSEVRFWYLFCEMFVE